MTRTGFTLRPINDFAIKQGPFKLHSTLTAALRSRGQLQRCGARHEIWTCIEERKDDSCCTHTRYVEQVA